MVADLHGAKGTEVHYWPELACVACGGATREPVKRAGQDTQDGLVYNLWLLECGHTERVVAQVVEGSKDATSTNWVV